MLYYMVWYDWSLCWTTLDCIVLSCFWFVSCFCLSSLGVDCHVLYCDVLSCIVLCRIVLVWVWMDRIGLYWVASHCIGLCCIVLHCIVLGWFGLDCCVGCICILLLSHIVLGCLLVDWVGFDRIWVGVGWIVLPCVVPKRVVLFSMD